MHILMIDALTIAHFLLDPWKNLRGQLRILDHAIDWKSFIFKEEIVHHDRVCESYV